MPKLCIINGKAPRYRESIFRAIDLEYDCDWYFGESKTDIKELDISLLKNASFYGFVGNPDKLYWKKNVLAKLFCKRYRTYIISIESRSITDYLFLLLKKIFYPNKRLYAWTHGWYGKESKLESTLKMFQFRLLDGIFVYGNRARELLIGKGISEAKIFTIHNSLNYDKQKALRKSLKSSDIYTGHFGNNNPVLFFIGRLTKVKNLDMLVEAVQILNDQHRHFNLVFVGDGSEKNNLKTLVQQYGLSQQVWFYGESFDEIANAELIYNADMCVAPGNVGLTAMHSMVFGTPVISHNDFSYQMPEYEAIHPGKTGEFFERGNVELLSETIKNWFDYYEGKRDIVRKECYKEIDTQWNPSFQMKVIKENLKFS